MKRRDFIKSALIVSAAVAMPALAKESKFIVPMPNTAEELYDAINTLGIPKSLISQKAREETPVGTYNHIMYNMSTYKIESDTEKKLVRALWGNVQVVFKECSVDKPNIFWRRIPEFEVGINFNSNNPAIALNAYGEAERAIFKRQAKLSMRLSIGPSYERLGNFTSFIEKKEGFGLASIKTEG